MQELVELVLVKREDAHGNFLPDYIREIEASGLTSKPVS